MGYDKFARPAQHFNMTVVSVKLTVRHVELDEDKSVFSVYGWLASVILKFCDYTTIREFNDFLFGFVAMEG